MQKDRVISQKVKLLTLKVEEMKRPEIIVT
jgi:hypothetical protein